MAEDDACTRGGVGEDVGWSHLAPLASLPALASPLADLLNRMFRNLGAERITVADALLHPWLTPAVPVGVPAGAMSDGEGVVTGLGGCEVSEGERAALVADMERRRAEVNRINAEEKEAARRAKQEARRCVCVAGCRPHAVLAVGWWGLVGISESAGVVFWLVLVHVLYV